MFFQVIAVHLFEYLSLRDHIDDIPLAILQRFIFYMLFSHFYAKEYGYMIVVMFFISVLCLFAKVHLLQLDYYSRPIYGRGGMRVEWDY